MKPLIHVEGKVALVTGGSRGIGESIARALGLAGAEVAIASRKLPGVTAAAERLRADGVTVEPYACHTGKADEIEALVSAVIARFGRIDVLVNNAATNPYFGPMMGADDGVFDKTFEVNAKGYLNVTEDHNYYIDQIGNTVMRLPLLEAGRRLVARGLINEVDDIFSLHVAEMREALLQGHDFRSLTTERKAEMERWAQVVPPPILGTPPPPSGDPLEDGIIRMFGMPPEPSSDPSVIQGLPASAGTVRGRAKVVRTLSEASKLEKGDIMVCEMTMPPWTPLFSTVSAVVADTGGILSHCAIVSREYRLPCVVGTAIGTAVIKDGMMLTVDGSRGIVRIEAV